MFAGLRTVNDGYFDALAIRRLVRPQQSGGVVVDQSIAEVLYDGSSPVGRTLSSSLAGQEVAVTGLVGAVREWNQPLHGIGTLYVDYREHPDLLLDAYLLVRVDVTVDSLARAVRATLGRVDPLVPVQIDRLVVLVGEGLAQRRLVLGIAAAFCLVTLTLASVGVYSVVAFSMRRSRREMAIRIALGARTVQVRRALARRGLRPAILGSLLGAVVALPAGGLLRSQLFGVEPYDPAGVTGAVVTLLVIAALAAYLPTRSAGRQDPVTSLRQQ